MDVEDVDTEGEDHIYDECRYVCMENPCGAPAAGEGGFDPLSGEETRLAPYAGRMRL
jgi:hypothetical protein